MNDRLQALSDAGVSIWLDDLSRERIETGNLEKLIEEYQVVGVTTNPTIFASALSKGERYNDQVTQLSTGDASVADVIFEITTTDVHNACDVFRGVYDATDGKDGRISIEVPPALARDADATITEAKHLWEKVDQPNLFIKIPAMDEALSAIAATIAEGISVNVTLIFSLERYRGVMDAYLYGLEQAAASGHDLSQIRSVASFFVSRVDSEYDKRLDAIGSDEAKALKGKAGIANARLAYQAYEEVFSSERWKALESQGAHVQRPLWASTGVKDPAYPDTMYVTELVVDDTVNTMPEKTLEAVADHGEIEGDTIHGSYEGAQELMDSLEKLGISYDEVVNVLEDEGVDKFDKSWAELVETVQGEMDKLDKSGSENHQ